MPVAHYDTHSASTGKKLLLSIILNCIITVAQIIGGLMSGSLSLLSDALHNFSDVLSLVISYIANRLVKKEASIRRTFGFKRAEVMAAFINASSLVIIAIFLIFEAIKRLQEPKTIESTIVILLSALAIIANGLSVLILRKNSRENMNMRSAYVHLITDMMASIAVLIGGLLMRFYQIYWIDSILTLAIAIYLIVMGYHLLKSSFKILMLFTPEDIEVEKLISDISQLPYVTNIHHVHIWQLNEEEIHLEAHIDFKENVSIQQFGSLLREIEDILTTKYGVNHVTLQPEFGMAGDKNIIVQD